MLSDSALEELKAYPWPGNVRELQNCIERAVILSESDLIQPRHLNLSFRQTPAAGAPALPAAPTSPWDQIDLSGTMAAALRRVSAEVERRKIEQTLKDSNGNKMMAADVLQMGFKALTARMRQLGLAER
jgi:DNA-binding NtrC family response regulator